MDVDWCCMVFSEMDSRERVVLLAALGLVAVVFAVSAYNYVNPPLQVWEARVFETFDGNKGTVIFSYGNGKLKLNDFYDIEVGATYRITYRSRTRNVAEFDITVERID